MFPVSVIFVCVFELKNKKITPARDGGITQNEFIVELCGIGRILLTISDTL